jgi:hypothetical protein
MAGSAPKNGLAHPLNYLILNDLFGGEGGIRTHVPVTRQDAFEAPPLRPLRYLSARPTAALRPVGPGPAVTSALVAGTLFAEFAEPWFGAWLPSAPAHVRTLRWWSGRVCQPDAANDLGQPVNARGSRRPCGSRPPPKREQGRDPEPRALYNAPRRHSAGSIASPPLPRRSWKNAWITPRHSSARTPPVTSNRWFSRGCSSACIADTMAPAFGSAAP